MTTFNLTARQKQILDLIHRMLEKHGYPPSGREIAKHLRIGNVWGVQKHIQALERKGYLRKGRGARALEVVGRTHGRTMPVLGRVAAGKPILAEENVLGTLTVDPVVARWKDAFLLKVKGESMTGAGLLDGDLVLVKPQPDAESGEIMVAMVEGEATVKRLIKKKDHIVLKPENPNFDPMIISERDQSFQILGKVMGVIRFPGLF
jgi:repressor LexA